MMKPSWLLPGAIVRHRPSGVLFPADRLKQSQTGAIAIANPGGILRWLSECEPVKALPRSPFLWQRDSLILRATPTPEKPLNGINFGSAEEPRYYEIREATEGDRAAARLAALFDGEIATYEEDNEHDIPL